MMIQKKIQKVDVAHIDAQDIACQISPRQAEGKLIQSIKQIGLTQPLVVQEKENGFRIVCGFARMEAVKKLHIEKVDAYVIHASVSADECFKFAILDNLSTRKFNAIETSRILNKLQDQFQANEDKIVKTWLPLLGYGRNPKIIQLYLPLAGLNELWQKAVNDAVIGFEFAAEISNLNTADSRAFYELLMTLHLGKNRQKEFLALLQDIARIEGHSVHLLLQKDDFQNILKNEKLTHSQKLQRMKDVLWEKRYPRYVATKNKFDSLLKSMKLPPEINLLAPPYFEGESFNVAFSFKNENDFKKHVQHLQACTESGVIEKVTTLT